MENNSNRAIKGPSSNSADIIDLKKYFMMAASNWYYFLIALLVALFLAYYYVENTLPTYRVITTLLIEEEETPTIVGTDNFLQGIGLRSGYRNIENQIDILSSRSTIRSTLAELPFEIDSYQRKLLKKASFYPMEPIDVIPHFEDFSGYNQEYSVKPLPNGYYRLTHRENLITKYDTIVSFGSRVDFQGGSFTILFNEEVYGLYDEEPTIYFKVYHPNILVEEYRERLKTESTSQEGSIVMLALEGTNKTKDKIFLDKLTEVYLSSLLEKKNREANRIIAFINDQLVDVSDSLIITENRLQEFRSANRIMDISAQGQQIIDQAVNLENEKARLSLEADYYEYLLDYLSNQDNQEAPISPASMDISDPLLVSLIQELSGLQSEYYSMESGVRNPLRNQLEIQLRNVRNSLEEILEGIMHATELAIKENDQQIRKLNIEASRLPIKERQLLGIERQFNLNNVLYTFLLQRRSEAQIQKASNKSDAEIIDLAYADMIPISPKSLYVFLIAIIIGIVLPFLIQILGESIKNRITSEEDLHTITDLPLVGYIPHSRLSYNTVVLSEPQSKIAEAFRSLRTRMEFFTREAKCPIILISSTMPGEGKTFTAVNLASAYSLANKNTLLIGFDLRRPNFPDGLIQNGESGLSTYLIGKNRLEDIIYTTEYPHLSIIPSGPIPPNPGELATSSKMKALIEKMKEHYDYIIIDSPPIGAVSDSYSIAAIADANILIVRHGRTIRRFLRATLQDAQAHGVKGISVLINDFRLKRRSYRYNYNYTYN